MASPTLSYALPAKPSSLRQAIGIAATAIAVASSVYIAWTAYTTRIWLESYVGGGPCGTPWASMCFTQQMIPYYCTVPAIATIAAHVARAAPAASIASRIATFTAIASWLIFGFVK